MNRDVKSLLDDPSTPDWFRRTVEREVKRPGGVHDTRPGFERLMAAIHAAPGADRHASTESHDAPRAPNGTPNADRAGDAVVSGRRRVAARSLGSRKRVHTLMALMLVGVAVLCMLPTDKGSPPQPVPPLQAQSIPEEEPPAPAPVVVDAPVPSARPDTPIAEVPSALPPKPVAPVGSARPGLRPRSGFAAPSTF